MIRVNLLRSATEVTAAKGTRFNTQVFRARAAGAAASLGSGVETALKIGLFVLPVLGIFIYEQSMIMARENELTEAKANLESLQKELEGSKEAIEAVEKFKQEQKKISDRIETVKGLSRERMRSIKALDALQTVIPAKSWLTRISIIDGRAEISGQAIDDMDISTFMQALEENPYFNSITLNNSTQVKNQEGAVKEFKVNGVLEGF